MAEIEAETIVSGTINANGHLVLTRHDGTLIDMGAVSGMKMNAGEGYNKVDAFSFIGPSDPGPVPNGSVWYDTNDVAGPVASDSQKGLVELATNAETVAGTDNQRAVTPSGLAAKLATDPGYKTVILPANSLAEAAAPASYPYGVSLMSLQASSGWSLNSGYGTVVTYSISSDRTYQEFAANNGGTVPPTRWMRSYSASSGGGGWTQWVQVSGVPTLVPASFTQTTSMANYPLGHSRLYFPGGGATGWDFASFAPGEVSTYRHDANFCRQTFTQHVAGAGNLPEIWHRTANGTTGWSSWRQTVFLDRVSRLPKAMQSGVISVTPSAANTPTFADINFTPGQFTAAPKVVASPVTTVPGTSVLGVGTDSITASGARICVTRSNTTATIVHWIAIQD